VGPERHIVVYKPVKPAEDTSEQAAYPLPLSSTTVATIQRHFQQYPASQAELELAATGAAEPSSMFAGGDGGGGGGDEVRFARVAVSETGVLAMPQGQLRVFPVSRKRLFVWVAAQAVSWRS